MITRILKPVALWGLALSLLFTISSRAFAQGDAEETPNLGEALGLEADGPPRPILTVTLRAVEGSLEDIAWMFSVAERSDMMELVEGFLDNNVGNLKGLDRTRPAGVMLFLQPSLPPRPVPVAYIPVSNLNDLMKTMELGPLKPQKVEGTENRYELTGRRQKQHIIYRDDYLYISQSEEYATREDLPIPADFTPPMTSKYDIAASLDIKAVPPLLRDAFLGFLRSQAEADLQRRDEEPESAYIARRTSGITMLENIEQFFKEADKIVIGLDASPEKEKVTLDFNLDAKPGSDYADNIQAIAGKPSAFGPLLEDDSQPLTLAVCAVPSKHDRTAYQEYLRAFETGLKERFAEVDGGELTPASEGLISRVVEPLKSTIQAENIDMCMQFREVSVGKFVILAAVRVVGGDTLGTGIEELISRAKEIDPNLDNLDLNVATHQGVRIHRLQGKDAIGKRHGPLGESPSAYVASSGRTAWVAVGGEEALSELQAAIDKMIDAADSTPTGSSAPFKLVLRASRWLNVEPDNPEREDEGREIALEAFKQSEDAIRVEMRPTDTGLRMRAQLDRSFVRFLGMMLARQYDKSQL
ncbi:MAG: hypothetical protein R3C18_04925 [Planctomycetaceae bacterium]